MYGRSLRYLFGIAAMTLLFAVGCAKNHIEAGADMSIFGGIAPPVAYRPVPKPPSGSMATDRDDFNNGVALDLATKPAPAPTSAPALITAPIPQTVSLAIARVQAPEYETSTAQGIGKGRYSVVIVRDVERYDDMRLLATLPHVRESFQVGPRFLPVVFFTDAELRQAATAQGAEILIVYTFDSRYSISNYYQDLSMILLDVRPDRVVRLTVTADATVLDARTGQVLGRATTMQTKDELAATWSSDENAQQLRRIAEAKAFTDLVSQIQRQWKNVVGP